MTHQISQEQVEPHKIKLDVIIKNAIISIKHKLRLMSENKVFLAKFKSLSRTWKKKSRMRRMNRKMGRNKKMKRMKKRNNKSNRSNRSKNNNNNSRNRMKMKMKRMSVMIINRKIK